MALTVNAKGGGSNFDPCPEGTHIARCIMVADMGFQETRFGTKEQVYIGFEVPAVRVEWEKDDQKHEGPALVGSVYTASIHEKSILGQHLTSWRGKAFTEDERRGFDLFNILGAPCMLSITHNKQGEKTYANISAIMRLPQGTPEPDPEGEQIGYTPQDNDKAKNFDKLPEWLQKKCTEGHRQEPKHEPPSDTYSDVPPAGDDWSDEIPFMRKENW